MVHLFTKKTQNIQDYGCQRTVALVNYSAVCISLQSSTLHFASARQSVRDLLDGERSPEDWLVVTAAAAV